MCTRSNASERKSKTDLHGLPMRFLWLRRIIKCLRINLEFWRGYNAIFVCLLLFGILLFVIIIHQTHYEKSDWSRAFNQFTIACEHDMINAISAADIAFIMSSSTSAWLPSPLECSPQKQKQKQRLSITVYKDFPLRIFLF